MATELVVSARMGGGALATPLGRRVRWTKARRATFLRHLAKTANVSRSVKKAGMARKSAYDLRDRDPGFAADWQAALAEAYNTLELKLLDRALNGEQRVVRTPDGDKVEVHQDSGMMLRLLAHHRAAVKGGAVAHESPESIKRRADAMRERIVRDVALIRERLGLVVPDEEEAEEATTPGAAVPAAEALVEGTAREGPSSATGEGARG